MSTTLNLGRTPHRNFLFVHIWKLRKPECSPHVVVVFQSYNEHITQAHFKLVKKTPANQQYYILIFLFFCHTHIPCKFFRKISFLITFFYEVVQVGKKYATLKLWLQVQINLYLIKISAYEGMYQQGISQDLP